MYSWGYRTCESEQGVSVIHRGLSQFTTVNCGNGEQKLVLDLNKNLESFKASNEILNGSPESKFVEQRTYYLTAAEVVYQLNKGNASVLNSYCSSIDFTKLDMVISNSNILDVAQVILAEEMARCYRAIKNDGIRNPLSFDRSNKLIDRYIYMSRQKQYIGFLSKKIGKANRKVAVYDRSQVKQYDIRNIEWMYKYPVKITNDHDLDRLRLFLKNVMSPEGLDYTFTAKKIQTKSGGYYAVYLNSTINNLFDFVGSKKRVKTSKLLVKDTNIDQLVVELIDFLDQHTMVLHMDPESLLMCWRNGYTRKSFRRWWFNQNKNQAV